MMFDKEIKHYLSLSILSFNEFVIRLTTQLNA
ncbi:hypothetical protein Gogos_013812 [Gossypium gossypioides]|uniref:Uncharacterized protein n=1 Tax=Gossypium gossypioides TaxID=34282 RepID=A0A7J9BWQ5_GOSGO|nr:hypothetical protein [Gossypium gossypioides]